MAETTQHRQLKRLACRWLRERGVVAVGMEVTDSTGRFRLDVAGWSDRPCFQPLQLPRYQPRERSSAASTFIVECKQSRSDFLRDGARASGLLSRRAALIEQMKAVGVQPHPAESLFRSPRPRQPGLFEGAGCQLDADRPGREARRLRLELAAIERRLFRGAKFARLARWVSATQLWLAAPRGLIEVAELPTGWGLIEAASATIRRQVPDAIAASEVLTVCREASSFTPAQGALARLLRNIAVANSRFVGGRTTAAGRPVGESSQISRIQSPGRVSVAR